MKICFWGNIAGALTGNTDGGGELQISFLAKALKKAGNEVVVVDYNIEEDFITEEGINVLKIKGWNDGIRFIRTFTHRLPQIYRSLKAQKADIYYCRIRDFRHLLAFWAARKVKAKFILGLASDLDILGLKMTLKHFYIPNFSYNGGLWFFFNGILNELVFPILLRKADLVLAQHEGQENILRKRQIKSVLFPNLFDLTKIPVLSSANHKDFIYVGSLDKRKGFIDFFELVKRAPSHTFIVIGSPRDKTGSVYFEKLKSFENVSLLGKLCHTDTMLQIGNSKAMISTSPMEGFPNVFIEAWACGIPVLSLYFDPGNVIRKEKLGEVADGNMDLLIRQMDSIKNTDEFARKAKDYVELYHGLNDHKIDEINQLFKKVLINGPN